MITLEFRIGIASTKECFSFVETLKINEVNSFINGIQKSIDCDVLPSWLHDTIYITIN
jgi:hypothetical protein